MAIHSLAFFACALAVLPNVAEGNAFRGKHSGSSLSMSKDQVQATVLQDVMAALGSGNRVTEKRLAAIEQVIKPTFVAMPKNEHGNLEDAAARYVLHRLFVQRHAMFIRGLDPEALVNQDASTTQALEDHIPSFVLSLFEARLKDTGLSLHELAVLAATLEHLIHDEAVGRLSVVYEAHNVSMDSRVGELELQNLIDTYMTIFIAGRQEITASSVADERDALMDAYPGWHDTQKFTVQVLSGVLASKASEPDFANASFSFGAATEVVEEIGERYGRWQDSECRDLKGMLTKLEHGDTGRVLLKDFYGAALGGNWQFSESVDYLRELGALDESDPDSISVMIPNYVNSPSNCVASSSIFSVCCINECEALMGQVERQVAAPEASTELILQVAAQISSATVAAPRELSQELRSRLEDIAKHHNGSVPLHGRLFGQWLHHAFPRECPFPHADVRNRMTSDQWMQQKGMPVTASKAEMRSVVEKEKSKPAASAASLPWTAEEKLVARHAQRAKSSWTRTIVLFAAGASFLVAIVRMALDVSSGLVGSKAQGGLLPTVQKQHAC